MAINYCKPVSKNGSIKDNINPLDFDGTVNYYWSSQVYWSSQGNVDYCKKADGTIIEEHAYACAELQDCINLVDEYEGEGWEESTCVDIWNYELHPTIQSQNDCVNQTCGIAPEGAEDGVSYGPHPLGQVGLGYYTYSDQWKYYSDYTGISYWEYRRCTPEVYGGGLCYQIDTCTQGGGICNGGEAACTDLETECVYAGGYYWFDNQVLAVPYGQSHTPWEDYDSGCPVNWIDEETGFKPYGDCGWSGLSCSQLRDKCAPMYAYVIGCIDPEALNCTSEECCSDPDAVDKYPDCAAADAVGDDGRYACFSNDNEECEYPVDCAGVPNGDAVEDCAGTCGGDAYENNCGECSTDDDGFEDCLLDCAGEWNGAAYIDEGCYNVTNIIYLSDMGWEGYQDTSECEEPSLCDGLTEVELWGEYYDIGSTTFLDLSHQGLTGSIPPEIGCLTNLEFLDLGSNTQLSGEIPSEIGNLTNLTYLDLHNTQLTGEIPESICDLTLDFNSDLFQIQNNQLCPPYPDCLSEEDIGYQDTSNCEELSLCDKEIEVELWGECYNIEETIELDLDSNELTGEIPSEIGNLENLTYLSLGSNQLTGEIPKEICNLNLDYFNITNNKLCPPYPECIADIIDTSLVNMLWFKFEQIYETTYGDSIESEPFCVGGNTGIEVSTGVDECGYCIGGWACIAQELTDDCVSNFADKGCGCNSAVTNIDDLIYPTTYYKDNDWNCEETGWNGIPSNKEECDVTEIESEQLCLEIGDNITPNTCCFSDGPYECETRDCEFKIFQPENWVNCGTEGENCKGDGSDIPTGGAIPGCTDSNASNYKSDATLDDGGCEYDEDVESITFRHGSHFKYITQGAVPYGTPDAKIYYENGEPGEVSLQTVLDGPDTYWNGTTDIPQSAGTVVRFSVAFDYDDGYINMDENIWDWNTWSGYFNYFRMQTGDLNSHPFQRGYREIIVKNDIPTFVNLDEMDYSYNYKGEFDQIDFRLPVMKLDIESNTIDIISNDIDEFTDINQEPITSLSGVTFDSNDYDIWKRNHPIAFDNTNNEPLETLGINYNTDELEFKLQSATAQVDYESDLDNYPKPGLKNDKTGFKNIFGNHLWKSASNTLGINTGFVPEVKFTHLVFTDVSELFDYRGLYLIQSNPAPETLGMLLGIPDPAERPPLMITEFHPRLDSEDCPECSNNDNDWIELWNSSTTDSIDLTGYYFKNHENDNQYDFCTVGNWEFPWETEDFVPMEASLPGCTLPPNEFLVLYRYLKLDFINPVSCDCDGVNISDPHENVTYYLEGFNDFILTEDDDKGLGKNGSIRVYNLNGEKIQNVTWVNDASNEFGNWENLSGKGKESWSLRHQDCDNKHADSWNDEKTQTPGQYNADWGDDIEDVGCTQRDEGGFIARHRDGEWTEEHVTGTYGAIDALSSGNGTDVIDGLCDKIDYDNFSVWLLLNELLMNKDALFDYRMYVTDVNQDDGLFSSLKFLIPEDFTTSFIEWTNIDYNGGGMWAGEWSDADDILNYEWPLWDHRLTDTKDIHTIGWAFTNWFKKSSDVTYMDINNKLFMSLITGKNWKSTSGELSLGGNCWSVEPGVEATSQLIDNWNTLRGDAFNTEKLLERVEYYYELLNNDMMLDNKRWNYFDWVDYETYRDVVDDYSNNLKNRIDWIDKNIQGIVSWNEDNWSTHIDPEYPPYGSYCNDMVAINYNVDANFNDGMCTYYGKKNLIFELNTSYVSWPSIEKVELEILARDIDRTSYGLDEPRKFEYTIVSEKYEMEEIGNNIWRYSFGVGSPLPQGVALTEDDYFDDFLEGTHIEYRFIKYIPKVYTVETGHIEYDLSRSYRITYDKEQELTHYFNDFIDSFIDTNLPIIKIDTVNYNDFGWVSDENPNLWYCPGKSGDPQPTGWESGDDECIDQVSYIAGDGDDGYYTTKDLCQHGTDCSIDCIDGTNVLDEPKVSGWMDLIYKTEDSSHSLDDIPQISTKIAIEARGFSSRGFPKKQWAIETQEPDPFPQCDDDNANYNLFCSGFDPEDGVETNEDCVFPIENDFVLLGPYRDRAYIRNALTYDLWDDLGHPSSHSKFLEFYLNNVYHGLYVMFEKPKDDRYRMDLGDTLECVEGVCDDDTGRNFIYSGDNYCCNGGFMVKIESGGEQDYFIMNDGITKVEYYDPDDLGPIEQSFIRFMVTKTDSGDREENIELLDDGGFIDYMLLQELSRNNEGYTRSQYWYMTEDMDKFYMGYIWDMNHAYGAVIKDTSWWSFDEFFAVGNVWKGSTTIDWEEEDGGFIPFHQSEIAERWDELRNDKLSIDKIMKRIELLSESFLKGNTVDRDHARWYYSNTQNYEDDLKFFKGWLLARITWMDSSLCSRREYLNIGLVNGDYPIFGVYVGSYTCAREWHPYAEVQIGHPIDVLSSPAEYKSFIYITGPYNNKVFNSKADKYVEFEWINSTDINLYLNESGDAINLPPYTTGDPYVIFEIKDSYSNELIHTFRSNKSDAFQNNNDRGNTYRWNLSRLLDFTGSFYIQAIYSIRQEGISMGVEGGQCIQTGATVAECGGFPSETSCDAGADVGCEWIPGIIVPNYTTPSTSKVYSDRVYFTIEDITPVLGCIDTLAINYNALSQIDDGSCKYQQDCDEKYLIDRIQLDELRSFDVKAGYNILSYPFAFSVEDVDFLDVLDNSYYSVDGDISGEFSDFDSVTANFNGDLYSAVYFYDRWVITNTDGLTINDIIPGMGFILETLNDGQIRWDIPR